MGTGPLQRLVSSGGWPLGGVLRAHSPPTAPPSLARESQHGCLLFHPLTPKTISQHSRSGINKTSCWHGSVPQGITRSVSSFYISSMLDESEMDSERVFIVMLRCMFVTLLPQILPLFCISIYFIIIVIFFFLHPFPVLTPLPAASIQPSLSTAQFQPEPQPAELG